MSIVNNCHNKKTEYLDSYWKSICHIHLLTKHYLLLAEELSDDFDFFLQPMKEHRDAYDHIIRVYCVEENKKVTDRTRYKEENMKKAIGHEYRAFFDTADWLSYICRKKIRKILECKPREDLAELDGYSDFKKKFTDIPFTIADLRSDKDVGDTKEVINEVDEYVKVLDFLINFYTEIEKKC